MIQTNTEHIIQFRHLLLLEKISYF